MSKRSEPTLSSGAADVSISTIDLTISEAIRSTVAASIGGLADNLAQVIENQGSIVFNNVFQKKVGTVEKAVKKARRENNTCKRKGNQQQLDLELVLR